MTPDDVAFEASGLRHRISALASIGYWVILLYRASRRARTGPGGRALSRILNNCARVLSGCYLSERADIGEGLKLPHPTGIVIGQGVRIGRNVTIYQNVTLGSSDQGANAYPSVGDEVTIFANAVVVGPVTIGERAVIGAGAVVLKDVPPGAAAVGNPARVFARRRNEPSS